MTRIIEPNLADRPGRHGRVRRWSNVAFISRQPFVLGILLATTMGAFGQPADLAPVPTGPLSPLRARLPAIVRHWEGTTPAELHDQFDLSGHYRKLIGEQVSGRWFAALVSRVPGRRDAIEGRFETEQGWWDFLAEEEAVVDLWVLEVQDTDGTGPVQRRKLSAEEIDQWRIIDHVVPTEVTVTIRSREGGPPVVYGAEFSLDAATRSAERLDRFQRDRTLRLRMHTILKAKGADGRIGALAQWLALREAVMSGDLPEEALPPPPASASDPFVAFEYSVDADGLLDRIVRVYRASGVRRRAVDGVVRLGLSPSWGGKEVEAHAFGRAGLTDRLEPVPTPLPGRDSVQLRVTSAAEPDPRRWNAVEFGAPEVIQQSALATFGLINAHTDRQRKLRAWEKSRYDLFAEPLFAALNIAAGVSGAPVPIGEAVRIPYGLTVGHWFLPRAPTSAQLRELFLLLATHKTDPDLQTRPANLLTEEDFKRLRERMRRMTEEEVMEVLSGISDEDLKAMVALARFLRMDSQYRWFVDLLSSVAKSTGEADSGVLKALFNSPYYSLAGEINIKNLIAAAVGAEEVIPGKTTDLYALMRGEGPATAWLQFFDLTVDIRAIANTIAQISRRNLADRELRRPFPHAPRLTDLAAYEVRIFGYPLLMFHKRGLLKDDLQAFDHDYAYGLLGTRVVEHFATREEMEAEILAGRMFPLGYVRVRDGSGRLRESNLAVFAHRIPDGKHRGKLALVIYGLKAYGEYSAIIDRERLRFDGFLKGLEQGAVIERITATSPDLALTSSEREPQIHVGPEAQSQRFSGLLGRLLEAAKLRRLQDWGGLTAPSDANRLARLTSQLEQEGIWHDPASGRFPVEVDQFGSTFRYRRRDAAGTGWREVEAGLIPSASDITRDARRADEGREIAEARRAAVMGRSAGLMMIHEATPLREGGWRLGSLLRSSTGTLDECGLVRLPGGSETNTGPLARLTPLDRVRLEDNRYSATLVDGSGLSPEVPGKVFVSVVFPTDPTSGVPRTDPETGVVTYRFYREGRLEREASANEVTVFTHDELGQEILASTLANLGTAAAPVQGALLEEAVTIEQWFGPATSETEVAARPRRVKVRLDQITGDIRREVYGAWPHPISLSDEFRVTTNRFSNEGRWIGAGIFENGSNESDFTRERLDALLHPLSGRQRLQVAPITSSEASGSSPVLAIENRDLLTGFVRTSWIERSRGGRIAGSAFIDNVNATRSFRTLTTNEYRDDFLGGRVPARTLVREQSTGTILSVNVTVSLDPLTRRRVATETDSTGNVLTNIWEGGLVDPVRVEGPGRQTEFQRNRTGLDFTGKVVDSNTGQELGSLSGQIDPAAGRWEIRQTWLYQPGITNRIETVLRNASGRWLSTRWGNDVESVPNYGDDGLPLTVETFPLDPQTGARQAWVRRESEFRFDRGYQDLLVETAVGGQPHDRYRVRRDPLGRAIQDGIRDYPGFRLETETRYDAGSERLLEAEERLNGQSKSIRTAGTPVAGEGGAHLLPITIRSGTQVSTQFWSLGGGLSRPIETIGPTGERSRVTQWLAGTALPLQVETADRHGRVYEKSRWAPGTGDGSQGLPEDRVEREPVDPWGRLGAAQTEVQLRGTDLVLRRLTDDEEIIMGLSGGPPWTTPRYALDRMATTGRRLRVDGVPHSNVTTVYRVREVSPEVAASTGTLQTIDRVDLRGFFRYPVSRQWIDANGRVLEERTGTLPAVGLNPSPALADIEAGLEHFLPERTHTSHYDPGFLIETEGEREGSRLLVYTNRAASGATRSYAINEEGRRELVTRVETRGLAMGATANTTNVGPAVLQRRRDRLRFQEQNPFLPDGAGLWIGWDETEFDAAGGELLRTQLILDERGRTRASRTIKQMDDGAPATKTTYFVLPSLQAAAPTALGRDRPGPVPISGSSDVSKADFVFCELLAATNTSYSLRLTDERGRTVETGRAGLDLWKPGNLQVLWLPNPAVPVYAATMTASAVDSRRWRPLAVAVPALRAAGFDVTRLARVEILSSAESAESVGLLPLQRLQGDAPRLGSKQLERTAAATWPVDGGITVRQSERLRRSSFEVSTGAGIAAEADFSGWPVVLTRESPIDPAHPDLLVVDSSRDGVVQPLYAVSSKDGRLLEHYRVEELIGATRLYRIGQGFQVPAFEVHDHRILADENSPGFAAYGYNYHVSVAYARAEGFFRRRLAVLRNRIAANAFAYYGRRAWEAIVGSDGRHANPALAYGELYGARKQAEFIAAMPTLASGVLTLRGLPWEEAAGAVNAPSPAAGSDLLRIKLLRLHVHRFDSNSTPYYPATYLIPPTPGAGWSISLTNRASFERYVDTAKEAQLIGLAADVGEFGLARDLLAFYAGKSDFGRRPLHASYDARTGTAMVEELGYRRAMQSRETAGAQVAIASAALHYFLRSGDRGGLTLASNLVDLIVNGRAEAAIPPFRSGSADNPRGLAQFPAREAAPVAGVRLWPAPARFPVGVNSRFLLLLQQLEAEATRQGNTRWQVALQNARVEQERWFRTYLLPAVESNGVVVAGLFQIQDIDGGETAPGLERWTSAGDWLDFLEAARALGIPDETLRAWLENLARVHAARIAGVDGLDWSLAFNRPPAISAELTAQFHRVARLLGHERAAGWAAANLARWPKPAWSTNHEFASVLTTQPPSERIKTGQGTAIPPAAGGQGWPESLLVHRELGVNGQAPTNRPSGNWDGSLAAAATEAEDRGLLTDLRVFVLIAAVFYASILVTALAWWTLRWVRRRRPRRLIEDRVMPDSVMLLAEERWARRILGMQTPTGAEHTRFSNSILEPNFLMQLRTLYKLVAEWRRVENGWQENDRRLVEDESDPWLNGMDEYVCLVGIYMRFVIKAGARDGFRRDDVLAEAEDSNHIWSRLVMFFSEYYWGMFSLMRDYGNLVTADQRTGMYADISHLLTDMGVRERQSGFDARKLLNHPTNPAAFDLLSVQKPGASLKRVLFDAATRLHVPFTHIVRIIERFKAFKRRESPDPIHPYLIELAKCLPHFVLMGLGALVWYNQDALNDSPLVPYLGSTAAKLLDPGGHWFWLWAPPLLGSMLLSLAAFFVRTYRFEGSMLHRDRPTFIIDATLTSLIGRKYSALPAAHPGWWWNPRIYEWPGWLLRCVGFLSLAGIFLTLETPSFATFFVMKGLFAVIALAEVGAVVGPLLSSWFSRWLQDRASRSTSLSPILALVNRLNLTPTRPASPLAMSLRYHLQASVPSADTRGMLQAVGHFFLMSAAFFFTGGYLCQQIFPLWFTEMYLTDANGKLFLGSLVFWNTMYLLRYGLFLLFTSLASFLATFPLRATAAAVATGYGVGILWGPDVVRAALHGPSVWIPLTLVLAALVLLEEPILAAYRRRNSRINAGSSRPESLVPALERIRSNPSARFGIVYMSGDDLGHQKLTADLLMTRWKLLRTKYGSDGLALLADLSGNPSEDQLRTWFTELYDLEKRQGVTLWHPVQLTVAGETARFPADSGLNLEVPDVAARSRILLTWHLRRWLVTMMSSAGHSQDTAVTLVDMALRLSRDGLAGQAVFYLIQNKYDDRDDNRPSQLAYGAGELAQRNKLARLLEALAPGLRAWSLQNWTPFGFKAGGMTGMDLVPEEALRLSTMVVLDRNATVHDLDAFMADLTRALEDPDIVILIPGRGTTNTLTELGQASQLIEEGHRSFLKGLMSVLGGSASESVGTGWGNIVACTYGRAQRAMMDPATLRMPLTSRMQRGANFASKTEGLIGFTPHAVGISEDTWAVSQAAHNLVALGGRVKFGLSQAFWHKIRETWSHAEWLASFPRWSGGFLQMMQDPIMQRINDFGPLSIFAREIRSHSGRAFLSAPFSLANVLLLPIAILFGVTPFVQILIILWNFGFIMNQVLTLHGLNVYLESSGFRRGLGLVGAAAGALIGLVPGLSPAWIAIGSPLGALYGGFFIPFHRWLFTRVRDAILFGPQLVLHTLGQIMRQTIEFVASGAAATDPQGVNMDFRAGAGPREDQPMNRFPHFINLRTVVWCIGLPSVLCILLALSELDMFNVLLLLPSLLFTVSLMIGPFLMSPRPGGYAGVRALLPRLAAWPVALVFYGAVSILVAFGGFASWLGLLLFLVGIAFVVWNPCRALSFRARLAVARHRLARLLINRNVVSSKADAVAVDLIKVSGDPARQGDVLDKAGVPAEARPTVIESIARRIHPLVQEPGATAPGSWSSSRAFSDFSRALVLALFVLLWFLVVPVPGLFVLSAGDFHASLLLEDLIRAVGIALLFCVPGYWIARLLESRLLAANGPNDLRARARQSFQDLQQNILNLSPDDSARRHALLMDFQTYLDQRSPAYAARVLDQLEARKAGR